MFPVYNLRLGVYVIYHRNGGSMNANKQAIPCFARSNAATYRTHAEALKACNP